MLEEFKKKINTYKGYCEKINSLTQAILESRDILPHQITHRVKSIDSLEYKIQSKGKKYSSLDDITDLIGLRIITYFQDDVDKIAEIIRTEFKVDIDNSIDKRESEIDKFGYKSLHFVVSLSENRERLPEYIGFKNLKWEIQIRSILQHSWAEIEHDLGYKNKNAIPSLVKRSFYRISALLEVVDIEFVKIKDELSSYKQEVKTNIAISPNNYNIDQDTLFEYINANENLRSLKLAISRKTHIGFTENYGDLDIIILGCAATNISTIGELDDNLRQSHEDIIKFLSASLKGVLSFGKATPIYTLIEILVVKANKKALFIKLFEKEPQNFQERRELLNI